MKLGFDCLSIEVTRRCNMSCNHCMRGEAQNKDISFETIDKALSDVSSINNLTFTGGEPTLNIPAIKHTLEVCKANNIFVSSFYVVTNGKEIPNDFLTVLIEWYAFIAKNGGELDMCGVTISKDIFHDDIDPINELKLKSLSFYTCDKEIDWNSSSLINLGNAKDLNGFYKRHQHPIYMLSTYLMDDVLYFEDSVISLTVDGDFLRDCDYEYNNTNHLYLGNVSDMNWVLSFAENSAA